MVDTPVISDCCFLVAGGPSDVKSTPRMDLLRRFHVLPHRVRSSIFNLQFHSVTVHKHWVNQSLCLPLYHQVLGRVAT